MYIFLKKTLKKRNKKKYRRYELIKDLLNYIGKISPPLEKDLFLKILLSYLGKESINNKNNDYNLYSTFEKIIDLYDENNFSRYKYLVEESSLEPYLKKFLLEEKNNINEIIEFHLGKSFKEKINTLFDNEYFKILQVYDNKTRGGGGVIATLSQIILLYD